MQYRYLGRTGLQVSELSFGSWVTYGEQIDVAAARECMAAAYDAGVNFFDNAEAYAAGKSEEVMGEALKQLRWPRINYVLSTKFYWGTQRDRSPINAGNTLNRKYLMHAIDGSLKRMQQEYIDVIFCHRPDPRTPIEETVQALSDIITQGKALYWGTSWWSADEIRAAWQIADRRGWHKPVVAQPQYNLFHRKQVEQEYARLYDDTGMGLTTWSPLASGLLTGKYRHGVPEGSRATLSSFSWLRAGLTDQAKNDAVAQLEGLAKELGGTVGQLAIAWVNKNPRVSTVILGASKVAQLRENLAASQLTPKLTPDVLARIDELTKSLAA